VAVLLVVPSESLDCDDHVMPGACFASQSRVPVESVWIRSDHRSHRRGGTTAMALRLQLRSSDATTPTPTSGAAAMSCKAAVPAGRRLVSAS
jgi:hypothetical protein